jgi:dihydroorotate dehydrogenase electron transfer subunit
MRVSNARIISTERIFGQTYLTWLRAPPLARGASPGQFLMLRCGRDSDPLLPRPLSYHRVRRGPDGEEVAILYRARGRGTALLARQRPGDELTAWGPLGRGYAVRPRSQNLLLVAGGMGIASLTWLAEQAVAKGKDVTLIIGVGTAEQALPVRILPPEVELIVATEDGSAGRKGLATEAFAECLPWADQVFACGPAAMYEAMAAVVRRGQSRTPVQVLLETPMACGTGLCYGCAIETRRGMRQVCRDGPRFELRDVF